MIAPVIPCYKIVIKLTVAGTFLMLVTGYAANMTGDHLFNCSLEGLLDWDEVCFDYTWKFKLSAGAGCFQLFLSGVHIPCLALLYLSKGAAENPLLPPGYLKLLSLVSLIWLAFPAWWFLSSEGIGYFQDTKMNAVGFAILNLISKGSVAFQVMHMAKQHNIDAAAAGDKDAARELGATRPRSGSDSSIMSAGSSDPTEVRAALSVTAWLVKFLRNFDDGASPSPALPLQDGAKGSPPREFTGESTATWATDSSKEAEKQVWESLEPMYRRFLRDAGVSQHAFEAMSPLDKLALREKFDKVASAIGVRTANKGMPQWAVHGTVTLNDATTQQLLTELQKRLEPHRAIHPEQEKVAASPYKTATIPELDEEAPTQHFSSSASYDVPSGQPPLPPPMLAIQDCRTAQSNTAYPQTPRREFQL
jgi:hypothetical protein